MSQPNEHTDRRIDGVAYLKGCGDFERVAHGQRHHRYRADIVKCFRPKWQKATDSRILEDEQRAIPELTGEHAPRLLAKRVRNQRRVPVLVERLAVVPRRPGGGENRVVEIGDFSGLPIPHGIVGIGFHQRIRQIATQARENPRKGGCSAAVHSGNQYAYFFDVICRRGHYGLTRRRLTKSRR